MNIVKDYITKPTTFPLPDAQPWEVVPLLPEILSQIIDGLGEDFQVKDAVAIHKTAVIGHNVTIKPPALISAHCFVGTNSYHREETGAH